MQHKKKPLKILFNKKFLEHNVYSEAEGAYRVQDFDDIPEAAHDGEAFISLVHDHHYIESIKDACRNHGIEAEVELTPGSYEAAKQAVGLAVMAAEQDDFAVIRPPGHHAGRARAAGFCLFNNIAIATQKLVNEGKKVFILDIDGHHGDGTQSIFYDTDKVLYCSIHQLYAYPFSGFSDETGVGSGLGFTLNFPLTSGSGDKEFLEAVDTGIMKAKAFKADVVGVSAGFDGYQKDRILQLNYSLKAYDECGFRLRRNFKHIFAVLEGGYHFDIRKCVDRFIDGVNRGSRPPKMKWDENMSIG